MRPRKARLTKAVLEQMRKAKGFSEPQRDTSKRAKRRAGLNNYNQQKLDKEDSHESE
jgi:hypothetical protein